MLFLDRLNIHSIDGYDVRRQVAGFVAQHLKPGAWFKVRDEVGDGAFRRLAHKVDLELLARLAKSDCLGREPGRFDCSAMDWFLERARALGVEHRPPPPILLGRHLLELGLTPGPRVGEILKAVYEQQMDGSVTTLEDAIAAARRAPRTARQSRHRHLVIGSAQLNRFWNAINDDHDEPDDQTVQSHPWPDIRSSTVFVSFPKAR